MADCETGCGGSMTFKDKKKFFEREIAQQTSAEPKEKGRKFSFLQEHEVATLKNEEAKKMSTASQRLQDPPSIDNDMQTYSQTDLQTDFSFLISDLTNRRGSKNCKSATERLFGKKPPAPVNSGVKQIDPMTNSTGDSSDFLVGEKADD